MIEYILFHISANTETYSILSDCMKFYYLFSLSDLVAKLFREGGIHLNYTPNSDDTNIEFKRILKEKTEKAKVIFITGAWGTGKSHFVKENLKRIDKYTCEKYIYFDLPKARFDKNISYSLYRFVRENHGNIFCVRWLHFKMKALRVILISIVTSSPLFILSITKYTDIGRVIEIITFDKLSLEWSFSFQLFVAIITFITFLFIFYLFLPEFSTEKNIFGNFYIDLNNQQIVERLKKSKRKIMVIENCERADVESIRELLIFIDDIKRTDMLNFSFVLVGDIKRMKEDLNKGHEKLFEDQLVKSIDHIIELGDAYSVMTSALESRYLQFILENHCEKLSLENHREKLSLKKHLEKLSAYEELLAPTSKPGELSQYLEDVKKVLERIITEKGIESNWHAIFESNWRTILENTISNTVLSAEEYNILIEKWEGKNSDGDLTDATENDLNNYILRAQQDKRSYYAKVFSISDFFLFIKYAHIVADMLSPRVVLEKIIPNIHGKNFKVMMDSFLYNSLKFTNNQDFEEIIHSDIEINLPARQGLYYEFPNIKLTNIVQKEKNTDLNTCYSLDSVCYFTEHFHIDQNYHRVGDFQYQNFLDAARIFENYKHELSYDYNVENNMVNIKKYYINSKEKFYLNFTKLMKGSISDVLFNTFDESTRLGLSDELTCTLLVYHMTDTIEDIRWLFLTQQQPVVDYNVLYNHLKNENFPNIEHYMNMIFCIWIKLGVDEKEEYLAGDKLFKKPNTNLFFHMNGKMLYDFPSNSNDVFHT